MSIRIEGKRVELFAQEIEALFQKFKKEHNAKMGEIYLAICYVLFDSFKRLKTMEALGIIEALMSKRSHLLKYAEALGCALAFLASKGLIQEFEQFLKEYMQLPLDERKSTFKEKLKDVKATIFEGS